MMYREQLDRLHCDDPRCTDPQHGPMDFYSRCHPEAGTWTAYHRTRSPTASGRWRHLGLTGGEITAGSGGSRSG
jgi:hypothetical protein